MKIFMATGICKQLQHKISGIWYFIRLSYLFSSAKSVALELIEDSANFIIFACSVNFYFVRFFFNLMWQQKHLTEDSEVSDLTLLHNKSKVNGNSHETVRNVQLKPRIFLPASTSSFYKVIVLD